MAAQTGNAVAQEGSRHDAIRQFLDATGWEGAALMPIPGDASFRHYARVRLGKKTAIVMDAPPERESVTQFLDVQAYFLQKKFSAPRLLAAKKKAGLLLLEDLGDDSFTRILETNPAQEAALYHAAIDVLVEFYRQGVADTGNMPEYSKALLLKEAALLGEWFLPLVLEKPRAEAAAVAFMEQLGALTEGVSPLPRVVVHRDYHADNLFWLPRRKGAARVGMLDFQDAVLGRPAYDVLSLLEDARRTVGGDVVASSLVRYTRETGVEKESFFYEYAFFGAQRNAKILGIFTRLCLRDKKPRYLEYIPRVWRHFLSDLKHPQLQPLREWQEKYLDDDAARLIADPAALKARAGV